MKLRLLSKLLAGTSVTLSLTQNGRTAGPLTVADWGASGALIEDETPSGGGIEITVSRTGLRCAPDSVRFGVDLSRAAFDTPGPAAGAHYDPRLHELVFLWDTGDSGRWMAPENVLSEWNDKSRARGPWIAHCYDTPGTYTVTLTVIEPSSGKIATATTTVEVEDPDSVYAGTETVCINPAGDGDFTGAPTGSAQVQLDGINMLVNDQSWWSSFTGNTKRRFLFKAGATYSTPVGFDLNSPTDPPHFYLGTYGGGAATLIVPPNSVNEGRIVDVDPYYRGYETAEMNDVRITNILAQGDFDPTTEVRESASAAAKASGLVRTDKYGDYIVSRCGADNLKNTAYAFYLPQGNGLSQGFSGHIHLNDCYADDFGGQYSGCFASVHDRMIESTMAVTGCRFKQHPQSISGGTQWRSPFRENGHHKFYLACSEAFGKEDSNSVWKIITTPKNKDVNHIVNIWGIAAEGNFVPLHIGQNILWQGTKQTFDANVIVDGGMLLGDYSTSYFIETYMTGVTLRNLWITCPDVPRLGNEGFDEALFDMNAEESTAPQVTYTTRTLVSAVKVSLSATAGPPSATVLDAPVSVYNCTFALDRPLTKNKDRAPAMIEADTEFTNIVAANNVWDGPWQGQTAGPNPDAPLSTTPLFTPRNIGWKGYVSQTLHPEFATPPDAARERAPLVGSNALGDALQDPAAYDDIRGKVRPVHPSRGAWEAP